MYNTIYEKEAQGESVQTQLANEANPKNLEKL